MRIHIEDFTFRTIIGILKHERITPQRVIVHAKIDYTYEKNSFINYADVCYFIESEMNAMSYQLLEDALEDLAHKLSQNYPKISYLELKILKPDILQNATVGLSKEFRYNKN